MKQLHYLLILATLFITSCNQREDKADTTTPTSDSHREEITRFQNGQQQFKKLIATVRDKKSFDAAKPGLDNIVANWHNTATALSRLEPPSDLIQTQLRKLIVKGNRATEPTGGDLISLISIESREPVITQWLQEFTQAGRAVGIEFTRLYGPLDHHPSETTTP